MGSLVYRAGRDIQPILPYRLLICFTLVTRAGVGQSDALEVLVVVIIPSVCSQIWDISAIHLSTIENKVTTSNLFSDIIKYNPFALNNRSNYRAKSHGSQISTAIECVIRTMVGQ